MFSAEDILAKIRRQPFRPLRIVATSGVYDIRHPELVMIGKRYVEIGTASAENPQIFDTMNSVALVHIAELQDLPTNAKSDGGGNGKLE